MKKFMIKKGAFLLFIIYTFLLLFGQNIGAEYDEAFCHQTSESMLACCEKEENEGVKVSSRLYELFFGRGDKKEKELYLIPSGDVFGIKLQEEYISVGDAEQASPLKRGDKIVSIDGKKTESSSDITKALAESKGGSVKVEIIRGTEPLTLTLTPKEENGVKKLGITIRKSATGIGTMTFIDPETLAFGGLGHGVCDAENGKPIAIKSGIATKVILGSAKRGEQGSPGELSGILGGEKTGTIIKNNECGVFGVLEKCDTDIESAIPVGKKSELTIGEAEIISTVKNGKKSTYKIEITEIDRNSSSSKSFKIKVTDPMLITLTGGIVRGMSGSPIIQNGKLVGAVTHVMVNDPTEGYGIFLENMIKQMNNSGE